MGILKSMRNYLKWLLVLGFVASSLGIIWEGRRGVLKGGEPVEGDIDRSSQISARKPDQISPSWADGVSSSSSGQLLRDSGFAAANWKEAVEHARELKGDERNLFLQAFVDEFSQDLEFDRVGFFTEIMKIKGPGHGFVALLTNAYSRDLDITPNEFLDEISKYELTDFEKELLFTSGGGVFKDATYSDLKVIFQNTNDQKIKRMVLPMLATSLSLQVDSIGAEQVMLMLGELGVGESREIVYNLVRVSPGVWWEEFKKAAKGDFENESSVSLSFKKDMKMWSEAFLNTHAPVDLLNVAIEGGDKFVEVSQIASAKWAAQDSAELAEWIGEQSSGVIRDAGIVSLSRFLNEHSFVSESLEWSRQVSDPQLRQRLQHEITSKKQ